MVTEVKFPLTFPEYQLIDSGDGQKFESFSGYKVVRPDPRVIWKPRLNSWQADAIFDRNSNLGKWLYKTPPPKSWQLQYQKLKFKLLPTDFRHVGVFPEQAVNWDYVEKTINGQPLKVLNLFGYTGGATLAATKAGAKVTHVDASKSILSWASENAALSGIPKDAIRWIPDDALKFVMREQKRESKYDGIILDPPRFGHGTGGEIWKLHEDLSKLLSGVKSILTNSPKFVLMSVYTADLSPIALKQLMESVFPTGKTMVFELALKESSTERLLPNGLTCVWENI